MNDLIVDCEYELWLQHQFDFPICSKTLLKLSIPRIKLLRNRREIQLRQMRRDIAKLLETGQEATARIRVFMWITLVCFVALVMFIVEIPAITELLDCSFADWWWDVVWLLYFFV